MAMRGKRGNAELYIIIGAVLFSIMVFFVIGSTHRITGMAVEEQDYLAEPAGFNAEEQVQEVYTASALGEVYLLPQNVSVSQGSTAVFGIYVNTALTNVIGLTLDLSNTNTCTIQPNLPDNDFWAILNPSFGRILIVHKSPSAYIPANQTNGQAPAAYLNCIVNNNFNLNQIGVSRITWFDGINREKNAVFAGAAANLSQAPSCGNGVVETGEQCDDGNNAAGDGCSSACTKEGGGDGGGGGGGGGTPIIPIEQQIVEFAPIPSAARSSGVSLTVNPSIDLCAGAEGKISGEIRNTGTSALTNVVISVQAPDSKVEFRSSISRKVYGWDNKEIIGIRLTGNPPYSDKLGWKTQDAVISQLAPGESSQWNVQVTPPISGGAGEIALSVNVNGQVVDKSSVVFNLKTPNELAFTERDGNLLNAFIVLSNKDSNSAVYDAELSLNKKMPDYRKTPGFIGLFNSFDFDKAPHTVQDYIGDDLPVNAGETVVFGQQFELLPEFYYDEARLSVTDSDTGAKVGSSISDCVDGDCVPRELANICRKPAETRAAFTETPFTTEAIPVPFEHEAIPFEGEGRKIMIIIPGDPTLGPAPANLSLLIEKNNFKLAENYWRSRYGSAAEIYNLGEEGYENVDNKINKILKEIETKGKIKPQDRILVFVAMHGLNLENEWYGGIYDQSPDYSLSSSISEYLDALNLKRTSNSFFDGFPDIVFDPKNTKVKVLADKIKTFDKETFSQEELNSLMKRLACSEKGGNGSNNVYLALSSCYSGLILGTQPIAGVKKVFTSAANTCSLSSPDGSDLPLVLFSNSSISLDDFDQNMLENMSRVVFEKYIAPFIRDDVMKSYGLDDLSDSSIEDMFLRNEPDLIESELQKNVEDFKKDMEIGLNKVFTESWPPLVQDGPAGVCE